MADLDQQSVGSDLRRPAVPQANPALLHFEEVGKVGTYRDGHLALDRPAAEIADTQVLSHSDADEPLAHDQDGGAPKSPAAAGPAHEGAPVRVVRDHRERLDWRAVHSEVALGHNAGVAEEQALWRARVDVAAAPRHAEGGPLDQRDDAR